MNQITTNGRELIIVGVPKNSAEVTLYDDGATLIVRYRNNNSISYKDLDIPIGNYNILSTLSAITEEQCVGLVELMKVEGFGSGFKDYEHEIEVGKDNFKKDYLLHGSTKKSFISLLRSKGILAKSIMEEPIEPQVFAEMRMNKHEQDLADYNYLPDDLLIIEKL